MKTTTIKKVIMLIPLLLFACNDPRTVVTDIVHADGSVTRKIEVRSEKNDYKLSSLPVPVGPDWNIIDSIEIGEKGDTVYVKRAEKNFANIELLNLTYTNDSSSNKAVRRHADFKRKFRWFFTEYRFEQIIDKQLQNGKPVNAFLDKTQLEYFYSPDAIKNNLKSGPDSLRYMALEDSINKCTDRWIIHNAVSEWIGIFSGLTGGKDELSKEKLGKEEDKFYDILSEYEDKFDSLWQNGFILREFIGTERAARYKELADSAMNTTIERLFFDFKSYDQRIIMPGKLIGTNGFRDSLNTILWPVMSDYFISNDYVMWAESKTTNNWSWIVTGIFVIFVTAGLLLKKIRKGVSQKP